MTPRSCFGIFWPNSSKYRYRCPINLTREIWLLASLSDVTSKTNVHKNWQQIIIPRYWLCQGCCTLIENPHVRHFSKADDIECDKTSSMSWWRQCPHHPLFRKAEIPPRRSRETHQDNDLFEDWGQMKRLYDQRYRKGWISREQRRQRHPQPPQRSRSSS